ncbi:MAG: signal peptide peptidase SppA [Gemmatimonadetes bacterium]|nr:signal peptide peptidase SppA [Gemmatimonadota bacterium]
MKAFFAALTANLVTVALCLIGGVLLILGLAASAGTAGGPKVPDGAILLVDLEQPLSDTPARRDAPSVLDEAFPGAGPAAIPLRAALRALRHAATDPRIHAVLLRGTVGGDGTQSGYAQLRELRDAIGALRAAKKPVHAFLVRPGPRDLYVTSAATTVTLDPFGMVQLPGLAAEPVFFTGLLEKVGVQIQVSRVGRFKAAVEPFTRRDMSPENRLQTAQYLGDLWTEVKRGIADSRGVDPAALQALADTAGMLLPQAALDARLVDRVAYFDQLLDDLRAASGSGRARPSRADSARTAKLAAVVEPEALPQVTLEEYARAVAAEAAAPARDEAVAVVYAEGDIVDGSGSPGEVGGAALARTLRRVREDGDIKAVVLRVNSPGGSAVASEQIQRELALVARTRPVVVSMGSVAASGGYWISTAATRIFAQPNTITGSIGVFSLLPNLQQLANRNGVTFDTVKTARYADLLSVSRPRTAAELAVLQKGTDAVYDAFLARVAGARKLPRDSVAALAEGRVWSGEAALRLGLVDSLGGLDAAIASAAGLAKLPAGYAVLEYPRMPGTTERLMELLERRPEPLAAGGMATAAALAAGDPASALAPLLAGPGPTRALLRSLSRELAVLLRFDDPRGVYARLPFMLRPI